LRFYEKDTGFPEQRVNKHGSKVSHVFIWKAKAENSLARQQQIG